MFISMVIRLLVLIFLSIQGDISCLITNYSYTTSMYIRIVINNLITYLMIYLQWIKRYTFISIFDNHLLFSILLLNTQRNTTDICYEFSALLMHHSCRSLFRYNNPIFITLCEVVRRRQIEMA